MSTKTLMQQLSQPYAEALLELAQKSNKLDEINGDVNILLQILTESETLTIYLNNPLISQENKKEAIKKLFNDQLHIEVLTFILLLIDRKRIAYLQGILNRYLEFSYALDSFAIADVHSSMALTDTQQNALIDKLKTMTNKQNIQLNISIDRKLIAGFTVQIGSKVIDTSLRGQLKEIGYFLGASNI
uniref:ATP synthase subunit delta, chloroplastic n=1 Tax=Helminthocladia australis TaxID=260093 RepID=A0A1G4NTD9_9FLOR|nr:ATP synthase CF1 subunit delta [Helminthocladia australis]SCW21953.1 ATP synthase CF1 subunit delta [Helminthocladia australis]